MSHRTYDPLGDLIADPFQGTLRGEAIRAAEAPPKVWRGRIPGELGIWIFIAGDLFAFGVIFCVLVSARMDDPAGFEASRRTLHTSFGALNTLLLLTGSLLVVRGVRAMRVARHERAAQLFAWTALCGAIFLVDKGIEYAALIHDGHAISTNLFYGYYFIATALHAFHLLLGLLGMLAAWRIARRPIARKTDLRHIEVFASYWHLVDLLWVVLFPLLYLMRV